jgi:hypothetical protein
MASQIDESIALLNELKEAANLPLTLDTPGMTSQIDESMALLSKLKFSFQNTGDEEIRYSESKRKEIYPLENH